MFNEKVEMNLSVAKMKIHHFKISQPHVLCKMHMHPELELIYITKGKILCYTENSCSEASSGEIVFINTNTAHYTESVEKDTEYAYIFFKKPDNPLELTNYLSEFLHKNSCPYHIFKKSDNTTKNLINIMDSMIYEYNHDFKARDYAILSKKYEILTLLYRNDFLEEEKSLSENIKPILPILNYIEENFQNPIRLEDISKVTNLHKNYVCRLFKKITKKTITDYITYIRICSAKELLSTNIPIGEIAYKVGFSSQSYFNKVFKKYLFYTPLEYKKLNENANH